MTTSMSSRAASSSGFTLVELMVTIMVVAILAAIAIPGYSSQVRKSRRTEARNDGLCQTWVSPSSRCRVVDSKHQSRIA